MTADDDHRGMPGPSSWRPRSAPTTSPNPWVGCVMVTAAGEEFEGATHPPGGPHAEAWPWPRPPPGPTPRGATAYVTLEPCSHHGRTRPAPTPSSPPASPGWSSASRTPTPGGGRGLARLRDAGIEVDVGVAADVVAEQLAPYLTHRRTGRPYVVLKLAASLDGRTAAPDGTSRWITGEAARADAHRLRAESDAVLVGAGTVRADDPRSPSATSRAATRCGWCSGRPRPAPGSIPAWR